MGVRAVGPVQAVAEGGGPLLGKRTRVPFTRFTKD